MTLSLLSPRLIAPQSVPVLRWGVIGTSIGDSCVEFIKKVGKAARVVRCEGASFSLVRKDGDVNQLRAIVLWANPWAI